MDLIQNHQSQTLHWNRPNPVNHGISARRSIHVHFNLKATLDIDILPKVHFVQENLQKLFFAQQNILNRPAELGPIESLSLLTQTEDQT